MDGFQLLGIVYPLSSLKVSSLSFHFFFARKTLVDLETQFSGFRGLVICLKREPSASESVLEMLLRKMICYTSRSISLVLSPVTSSKNTIADMMPRLLLSHHHTSLWAQGVIASPYIFHTHIHLTEIRSFLLHLYSTCFQSNWLFKGLFS